MLPNLVIIGAMKCGTTSLHYYLGLHPRIRMSREKELEFFIAERNWSKGAEWYAAQFDGEAQVHGESSPNYTAARRFPGVAARMHQVIPSAKLIFMVRDPVQRLIAHYVHNSSYGNERRPLCEVIHDDHFLERSMYWLQLREYLAYFPADRILIVSADDLREYRRVTMRRVFEFLEVDPDFYSRRFQVERHPTSRKRRKTRAGAWLATTKLAHWMEKRPQPWRWVLQELLYLPFSTKFERPVLEESERLALVERLREDAIRFRDFTALPFTQWSV
ncbi:MAG: sulfotransferase family protein [Longimicrobiales bacterium]